MNEYIGCGLTIEYWEYGTLTRIEASNTLTVQRWYGMEYGMANKGSGCDIIVLGTFSLSCLFQGLLFVRDGVPAEL